MSLQQALQNTSIIQTPWSQDYSDYNKIVWSECD